MLVSSDISWLEVNRSRAAKHTVA